MQEASADTKNPTHTEQAILDETVSLKIIALALGISTDQLKRSYRTMNEDYGFPLPIHGANWRWPSRAVQQYLRQGGYLQPPTPQSATSGAASAIPITHEQVNEIINFGDNVSSLVTESQKNLHETYGAKK